MSARNELVYRGRMDTEDTEIDVFGAEKYFNEGTNYSQRIASKDICSSQAKEDPLKVFSTKEKPHMAERSIQSESSWTSWSALLHPISRNEQPRKARNVRGKSFLARIGFWCSSNDKTSVEIYDCMSENIYDKNIKSQPNSGFKKDWHRKGFDELGVALNTDDHFSFPVPNPETPNQPVEMKLPDEEDKKQRETCWKFLPSRDLQMYSDIDGDASSDFFEIESLSKNANYPFLSWQESDGASSCCALSEASTEWSISTASALNFGEHNFDASNRPWVQRTSTTVPFPQKATSKAKTSQGKDLTKRRLSFLLSCRNHEAVGVAEDLYTKKCKAFPSTSRHQRSESFTSMTRFQAENKIEAFDHLRNRQFSFDARFLSRSNSEGATHLVHVHSVEFH